LVAQFCRAGRGVVRRLAPWFIRRKGLDAEALELASPQKIGAFIVAFGEDAEGELYVLTNGRNMITGNTGKVYNPAPM
jgi:hypothetical protein